MSALGWVVGGSGTVVAALLEALGPSGTLVAYVSWQEHVYHAEESPAEHRAAYLAEPPVFDLATAEAARDPGGSRSARGPGRARAALEAGIGTTGRVGAATCHLFPAAELVRFGTAWIDARFS